MHSPFDTLAKGIVDAALSPYCTVTLQEPSAPDTTYADTVVVPRRGASPALMQRGLLGRMVCHPAVIEAFSSTPSRHDVDRCDARVSWIRARTPGDHVMWVISQGRPRSVLAAWSLTSDPAWGAGVYTGAPRAPRVVVVRELPRTRDTLLLRLMGRGVVLRHALTDLHALPADAWERAFVPRLLLLLQGELARMTETEPSEEELMMRYKEIKEWADEYLATVQAEAERRGRAEGERRGRAEGERRGRAEGERRGRAEGEAHALRESVRAMCEVLAIPLDETRRAQLDAADLATLQSVFEALRRTRALPS